MRRLTTIVAVDIAGYSARTEADEAGATADVATLRRVVDAACAEHRGRLFNTAGDGFMLEFGAVSDALAAAEHLVQASGLPIRVGVHLGEVTVTESGDLLGHGVNVAARLEALAEVRSVLVSADVKRALRGPLAERLIERGKARLDKMEETLPVFALRPEGVSPPRPATAVGRRWLLIGGAAGAVTLTAAGGVWWATRPRLSPRAQELYDKAQAAMTSGLPDDSAQAQGYLREAVTLAPDSAKAWGALALAYRSGLLFTPPARQAGVIAQARGAAQRALELDPDEGQALAALALLATDWKNWSSTETLYLRALSRHARDAQIEFVYGQMLLSVGRIREALQRAQAAVKGDEFAVWHRHLLTQTLWAAGRLEEADQTLATARARWPRHYVLWFLQLGILTYTGRADRAVAMAEDLSGRPANIPDADLGLSLMVAKAMMTRLPGDIAQALAANLGAARRGLGYAENAITMLAAFGKLDDAFAVARAMYLGEGFTISEKRFASGQYSISHRRLTYILFMPPTAPMRADPRFPKLMQDIGLADYWRKSAHPPDDASWAQRA